MYSSRQNVPAMSSRQQLLYIMNMSLKGVEWCNEINSKSLINQLVQMRRNASPTTKSLKKTETNL